MPRGRRKGSIRVKARVVPDERLEVLAFRLTKDQRDHVKQNGGADLVRSLIDADIGKQRVA
jgi:hypothetical protein